MNKKAVIVLLMGLFLMSPVAMAFTLKGYVWGRPLSEVRKDLEARGKTAVFDDKKHTLVFSDKVFEKDCEISLLFTPKTDLLAGVAVIWRDPAAASLAQDDLIKKYGAPAPIGMQNQARKYFVWASPTSRFDRIILIAGRKRTKMAYYGGEFYKKYMEESSGTSKNPVSGAASPEGLLDKK